MQLVQGTHFENHWTQCNTCENSHLPFHRLFGAFSWVVTMFGICSMLNGWLCFILSFYFIFAVDSFCLALDFHG